MLAKRLNVTNFEAGPLQGEESFSHIYQLTVGEDIATDEAAATDPRAARCGGGMVEQAATRTEQSIQRLEVFRHPHRSDIFERSHRRNRALVTFPGVWAALGFLEAPNLGKVGAMGEKKIY